MLKIDKNTQEQSDPTYIRLNMIEIQFPRDINRIIQSYDFIINGIVDQIIDIFRRKLDISKIDELIVLTNGNFVTTSSYKNRINIMVWDEKTGDLLYNIKESGRFINIKSLKNGKFYIEFSNFNSLRSIIIYEPDGTKFTGIFDVWIYNIFQEFNSNRLITKIISVSHNKISYISFDDNTKEKLENKIIKTQFKYPQWIHLLKNNHFIIISDKNNIYIYF